LFASRRWMMARTANPLYRRVPLPARLLVKVVACSMSLEWLQAHLGVQVILTTRHPCGFVASSLRMFDRGQGFYFLRHFLAQPRLLETYFADDREWIETLRGDRAAELAAVYGMAHRVMADQLAHHPEWTLAFHEDLCTHPIEEFRRLCDAAGIDF